MTLIKINKKRNIADLKHFVDKTTLDYVQCSKICNPKFVQILIKQIKLRSDFLQFMLPTQVSYQIVFKKINHLNIQN